MKKIKQSLKLTTAVRLVALSCLLIYGTACTDSREPYDLQYVTPETVGWSSDLLKQAETYAQDIGSAAVMALKGEKIFIAWGDTAKKFPCHSIRKPFVSALYGLYVERGMIDLAKTLEDLSIDDIPPALTSEEKRATIRDLLMSRSGVFHEAAAEAPAMRAKRPARGSHPPGTIFYYNNWDFNVLGTIFEQITEKSVFKVFNDEIAQPIGMQDFLVSDGHYHYEREKSLYPAYPFNMSTRDLGRFGLLYLNKGYWGGKRILSADWIKESTTAYSTNALSGDPYGYMWSIIPEDSDFGSGFYHTGLGVHLLAVLPAEQIVIVHRVDTRQPTRISWPQIRKLMEMIMTARN